MSQVQDIIPDSVVARLAGFRISGLDVFVLALTAVAAPFIWRVNPLLSILSLFVVGHFFLFCNVVRMRRSYELIWAFVFIANVVASQYLGASVYLTLLSQLPVTGILVFMEIRSPRYHGVWCSKLNSDLDQYLVTRWQELQKDLTPANQNKSVE